MNKQAAEKIASEYYNMGINLALENAGLTKQANRGLAALLGGGATMGGMGAMKHMNPELLAKLQMPGEYLAQKGGQGANQLMEYLSSFKNLGGI